MLLLFALSCSDYGLKGKPPGSELGPDIEVEPGALDLVVCGEEASALTIRNVGDASLVLSAVTLEGGGWEADTRELPDSLAAGEEFQLPLQAGGGSALLSIESSDPDEPLVEVPLTARADAAPSARIDAPLTGEILASGEDLLLAATVGDAEDGAAALDLAWASSLDGILSEAPASADGLANSTWTGAGRSPGVAGRALISGSNR